MNTAAVIPAPRPGTLSAPAMAGWMRRAEAIAALDAPPDPGTGAYTWLIWQWHLQNQNLLTAAQQRALDELPASVRALRRQGWTRQFLDLAADDAAGRRLTSAGPRRTQWTSRQRRLRLRGTLPSGRTALLNRVDGFTWTPTSDQWDSTLAEVRRYADEHGRIPTRGEAERLAIWLSTQRLALRSDRLSYDRAQALTKLPGWTEGLSSTRAQSVWERRVEHLRGFLTRHGRYPSASSVDAAEVALAKWVKAQRDQMRRDGLSPVRFDTLESLPGWNWGAHGAAWDEHLAAVAQTLRRGDAIRPDHPEYSWLVVQRRKYRSGLLTRGQEAALRELGLLRARVAQVA